MSVFFQTSRQRSFLSACRIAGKKWSASVPLFLAALLTVVFYSCRDEDLLPSVQSFEQGGTRAEAASTSGLDVVQDATGATYKPNCRVPLVGEGRVINQITKNLVGVLSNSDNKLEYLVDKNLDNSVSLKGLAEVNAGLPILSVKDVNRVYYDSSNGIKVGFLYKAPGGLLSLNVLQGFWVKTYLKGKEQDGSSTSGSGDKFQLLNLNLLNVSGGLSEISFTTTKPFDEVRIGCASISVDVLSGLEFYYAFVGENPKKIAAEKHEYPYAEQERPLHSLSKGDLVNKNLNDGPVCELVSGLLGGLTCRVDFGATIPVGSEVGYYTTGGGLASISLGATKLNAYDTGDNNPQSINTESGIGVSALAGGAREFSMILTKKDTRRLELDLPSGINLLSAVKVHYAYSRDPVEIDVSSYFTIGNDTISTDYYNLPTPSEGSVIYSLISWPSGATSPSISGNHMTGMTVNGDYVVKAVYTREEKEISWSYAVIHRNKKEAVAGCNTMMINTSANQGQYTVVESSGSQGGISLFNKINNRQNLVDGDYTNYAEATNVLSLIQFGSLAGVHSSQDIAPQGGKTRVGFVMQTNNQLLGADVLKFFFIRLYKDGEEVFSGLTAENDAIGVGLVGNDGSKLRFYVETDKTFDQVELWTAGLLNVNLNTFRLYYAFYEPTTCEEYAGTSEACMEMITAQKHGATINYAETKSSSAASVGATMNNLSYVIDNSQQTAASIVAGVSLISRSTVAVKFNSIRGGQPVGAILRTPGYVLNASVLQNVAIAAYNGGQAVASESTSGGLASIEVISDAGLAYMEVTPLQDYDEVRISFPSLADALETVWLSGFYIRPDANGNGIPDCAEEPDDQGETDIAYKSITEHVCVDETTYLGNVRIFVDAQDDKVGTKLTFTCYPYNGNGQKIEQEAELRQDDKGYFFELSLPVGDYSISGLSTYNGLRAQVHPLKTTWKRNASDTDWNNWSNWTDGSPWGCTNVVIPAGATRYPDLNAWGSVDKFYGGNYCANIHFEPGAAVLNTQYLEYDCAYVEMEVQSGMYHMISTPLHGMVTGDMFVSPEMPAYFTPLNGATYREVRHNPIVRQKMYSRAVTTATSGTNGTVVATADWSRTFNAVAQPYEQAQGIKMMVGNDWGTSYRLRFPKAYTEYNYYTLSGECVKKETLPVEARNMNGKFAYEVSGFNPENAGNSFTFELRNDGKGATYFVAGNPFMSYLDIKTFLTENKQFVQAIRIIDSESVFGEEEGLVRISLGKNGDLSFNVAGEQSNTIAPLQAFYVEALEGYTSDNVNITYTSDMFVQPSASTATRSSRSASVPTAGEMKISAVSGNSVSSCSLIRSAGASDAYNAKEDIVSLIDEDFMPKVKVYTVADKRALDIQKMSNATRVGLGFMVKDGSQQTEFTLDYGSNWKGWTLVDKQTGKRYLLDGTSLTVNAGAMKSNDGRFYLVKE
ncbi:hypothetical protein LK442_11710 [Phocaeicola coprocola DSM 17136]|uniref:Uncharacterized protein n=1 Tax=Phocaeicola coprocola DSM 17136 TaxID=470145 RepID=B3JNK3_9BACT|nr:hypothetical protein [Phocaeicola coprocola]EDU99418.1 hypothetical protein BACCOP_03516 [Phocaeicola coprocola DSM 17136]MCC3348716.1 hypothetical protein [Phocaeicola coprocola DSM 17136]